MKKFKSIFVALFFLAIMLMSFGSIAVFANNNISEYVKDSITFPDFSVVKSDSTNFVVLSKSSYGNSVINTVGIILLSIGILFLIVAITFLFVKIKRNKLLSIVCGALALICIIIGVVILLTINNNGKESEYYSKYGYPTSIKTTNTIPNDITGFTEDIIATKILSTFEFGLESKYNKVSSSAPHYWANNEVEYNFENEIKNEILNTTDKEDNYAYWQIVGKKGNPNEYYGDAIYSLYMPNEINFLDTRPFSFLRFTYMGINGNKKVNLSVIAEIRFEAEDGKIESKEYDLGTFLGESKYLYELYFPLSKIPDEYRGNLARVIFRTECSQIKSQQNRIFYADLCSIQGNNPKLSSSINLSMKNGGGVIEMESEYLGSLAYNFYGAYSASGFYDKSDSKYKLWYGCGIPENAASDNIYYIETTDINLGWSKPKRLILNDPTGKLTSANIAPGYGGDPSVIKIDGKYYMYFSGLESTPTPPNKIYLATSLDGINYTVYGPVVNVAKGEGLGYGAGSPSVIYKDSKFYLYYYTQSYTNYYTDGLNNVTSQKEDTGFVLKVGDTPYTFGKAQRTYNTYGAADVKWVENLNMWVACDYTDGKEQGGYNFDTIRVGFSLDGLTFDFTNSPLTRPVQEYSAKNLHNPGWIGMENGFGYTNMFLTYGVNDLSLHSYDNGKQMDSRQLSYTRLSLNLA